MPPAGGYLAWKARHSPTMSWTTAGARPKITITQTASIAGQMTEEPSRMRMRVHPPPDRSKGGGSDAAPDHHGRGVDVVAVSRLQTPRNLRFSRGT